MHPLREFLSYSRRELPEVLKLALPVVFGEIGWSLMGTVDIMMVGALGPVAMGAASLGTSASWVATLIGAGMLFGLDTLVSQAYGAGDRQDCNHSFRQAIYLAFLVTPPLMLALNLMPLAFAWIGVEPTVHAAAVPFVFALSWGTLPLLLYMALRRFLQAQGVVKPVMIALLSANLVNLAGNWCFIHGVKGWIPAMGSTGSAWATAVSRVYMCGVLLLALILRERATPSGLWSTWSFDLARVKRLSELGLPAAAHLTLEVGVFSLATALAAKLAPASLAAHTIGLSLATITFMVPLGVSSAAAVTVGQALGRGDAQAARWNGWLTISLAAAFMTLTGLTFALVPEPFLRMYTSDADVVHTGTALLAIAAAFQIFDGLQVATIGALRGAGDTRTPVICNFIGYWILGLPLGFWLCFARGGGIAGLWLGLCAGLIFVGATLVWRWSRIPLRTEIRAA